MIHDRFDLARWTAMFPLEQQRAAGRRYMESMYRRGNLQFYYEGSGMTAAEYIDSSLDWYTLLLNGGDRIVGPYAIAVLEQIRAEWLSRTPPLERTPTDVFVFARGEPLRRELTKVGGLPYWPAHRSWPRNDEGMPLAFLAQFCFSDSRDITGELPGDVLLIFTTLEYHDRATYPLPDWERMHFEWLQLGETNLIHAEEMPPSDLGLTPLYGEIHRTFDYTFGHEYDEGQFPSVLDGTKIGGIPIEVQCDPREGFPGRFLCTLAGTALAHSGYPYPYLNTPEPFDGAVDGHVYAITWGDSGLMHIMIEDGGQLQYTIECH